MDSFASFYRNSRILTKLCVRQIVLIRFLDLKAMGSLHCRPISRRSSVYALHRTSCVKSNCPSLGQGVGTTDECGHIMRNQVALLTRPIILFSRYQIFHPHSTKGVTDKPRTRYLESSSQKRSQEQIISFYLCLLGSSSKMKFHFCLLKISERHKSSHLKHQDVFLFAEDLR